MIADAKSNAPINDFRAVLSEQSTWGEGRDGAFPATHTRHQTLGGERSGVKLVFRRGDRFIEPLSRLGPSQEFTGYRAASKEKAFFFPELH